ncbi:hypothetical protein AB0J82_22805 [Asanoa sp. NPDC049518]|uniref:hypothetical protein n=1 Tax=unclassified Asanoa TaxID=2685164 RepID=UPI00343E50CA
MNVTNRNRTGPPRWVNRVVLGVLRSPAHALLDARICELTYRLPRSGRVVALPVRYVADGDRVLVAVGNADAKRWWRAFRRPRPVSVRLRGRVRDGTGCLLVPSTSDHTRALMLYRVSTGAVLPLDTPLVVIDGLPQWADGDRHG